MRFSTLQLLAYGHFKDKTLEFDAKTPFHLIYGDNEAGKSTSLRAVCGLLYGIPVRTPDKHRFTGSQMRLGATLQNGSGQSLTFLRKKANNDTLRTVNDEVLGEAELAALLGGISQDIFESQFCCSHAALRAGSKELAISNGELGESLFQAGGNLRSLHLLLKEFADEEDKLWKGRAGGSGHIANRIGEIKNARQSIKDYSLSGTDRNQQEKQLAENERTLASSQRSKEELEKKIHRLERVKVALPVMTQHTEVRRQIAALGEVIELSAEAPHQREKFEASLTQAGKDLLEAETDIGKAEATLQKIAIPDSLLVQGDAVAGLYQGIESYRQASQALPQTLADHKRLKVSARDALAGIAPEKRLEDVENLRPLASRLKKLRELASRHLLLAKSKHDAEADCKKSAQKRGHQKKALEETKQTLDSKELKREIKKAEKAGPLEDQLADKCREREALAILSSVNLKALGLWQGSLGELEALPVPPKATIDRFKKEFDEHLAGTTQLLFDQEKCEKEARRLQKEKDDLLCGGKLCTKDELEQLRQERDCRWRRIRGLWLGERVEADGCESGLALAGKYEELVAEADQAGDLLHRESERVAKLGLLKNHQKASQEQSEKLCVKRRELEAQATKLNGDWLVAWQPCSLQPWPPQEMAEWLADQQALRDSAAKIREKDRAIKDEEDRIEVLRQALGSVLAVAGQTGTQDGETLGTLIDRAEQWQQEQESAHKVREDLEKEVKRLDGEQVEKQEALDAAEKELTAWEEIWRAAVAGLEALGAGEPENVVQRIEDVASLIQLVDQLKAIGLQIEKYEIAIQLFTKDTADLTEVCAPDLGELPPDLAVAQLKDRLDKARSDLQTREQTQEKLDGWNEKRRRLKDLVNAAQTGLNDLMRAAGCEDIEALKEAETQSAVLHDLKSKEQSFLDTLMSHAGGAKVEDFITELKGENVDDAKVKTDEFRERLQQIETDRDKFKDETTLLRHKLDAESGGEALEAALTIQGAVKRLQDDVDRYVRVKLARFILDREIERYRQTNQNPVLSRASDLFRKLTHESFKAVAVQEDNEKQFLVGVRGDDNELRAEAMSDGTRDQLFLALRMASLENSLKRSTVMPLLVDDILIQFDDKRAKAAFEVLGEISQKTQVLFFTHHSRLIEIGQGALGKGIQVHSL